ncbi:hypothetical protein BH23BAC1_BH23BAC1_22520 [soil metagenome]
MKMKILILAFLLITFLNFNVQAQIEKGSRLVGGAGYVLWKDPFLINLSPNLGYFLSNRLVLGSSVGLMFYGYEDYSNVSIALTPFTRYYFGRGGTRLFVLASLGYRREWGRSTEGSSVRRSSFGHASGNLGLGLTHLITEQIGLEAILDIRGINVGFQIYIPSSK